ncbi:MAG: hypothetical protein MJ094_05985 [Saccharofermentans sp.]|nr:hypothetical protein [Saccharofermentans sp.]
MLSIVIIADCYANIITDISNAFKTIIVSSIFAEIIIYAFLNLQGTFFLQHNELAYIPSEESLDYYAQIIEHNNLYNNWGYHPVIVSESKAVFSIIDGTFEGPYHFSGMTNPVDYIINLPNDSVIVMSETYLEDNWQNPTDVYEYVINNYDVIDSYNGFNYYLKAE